MARMISARDLGVIVDDSGCDVDDLVFCGAPELRVPADVLLDDVVAFTVQQGWAGLEGFSGSEATIAEAVRSNAAAHGYRISDVVSSVITWDLEADQQRTFPAATCGFDNEMTVFGQRFVIQEVRLLLKQGDLTAPLQQSLAELLGVEAGERVPVSGVRETLTRARLQR